MTTHLFEPYFSVLRHVDVIVCRVGGVGRSYLALARGVVNAEARQVGLDGGGGGGDAAQLAHCGAGRGCLLEVYQRRARRAIHAHRRSRAASRHRTQHLHTTHHRLTITTHPPPSHRHERSVSSPALIDNHAAPMIEAVTFYKDACDTDTSFGTCHTTPCERPRKGMQTDISRFTASACIALPG